MSDNWVVQNLENTLETWNEKLSEIWTLITTTPQNFKGGNCLLYTSNLSPSRKYWTVIPKGYDKPIRLKNLGADYTRLLPFRLCSKAY